MAFTIYPTQGSYVGGEQVTVSGEGLGGGTSVSFDGVVASVVRASASGDSLVCITPAHLDATGPVDVSISTAGGTSTLRGGFTYQRLPPSVSSISPNQAPADQRTPVRVHGSGFFVHPGPPTVDVNGLRATDVVVVSPSELAFTIPTGPAGSVTLTVTNPDGLSASLPGAFTRQEARSSPPTSGPPAMLGFISEPGNIVAGSSFSPVVTVGVFDAAGILCTTANPYLRVEAHDSTGGVLASTGLVQATNGVASFPYLPVTRAGVAHRLTAIGGGLTNATSLPFDVTAGAPALLYVTQQPTVAAAGSPLSPAVQVAVWDAYGNLVPTATNPITLSLGINPLSATLGGNLTVAAVQGVATLPDLTVDRVGTGYRLQVSSPGLSAYDPPFFDVTPGAPTTLAFLVGPRTSAPGQPMQPAVRVSVRDACGNLVTSATSSITIALATNPAGGVLGGTLTRPASGGVATFDDLVIDRAGTGFTLRATAAALTSATSGAFSVVAAAAPDVVSLSAPSGSLAGSVPVSYAVSQRDAERVDVIVELDPGTGIFRRASQAPADPGSGVEGTQGVTTVAALVGAPHVFLWDVERDFAGADTTAVRIRVTASLRGLRGVSQTTGPLTVRPTASFAATASVGSASSATCIATADVNLDGLPDLALANGDGTISVFLAHGPVGATSPTYEPELVLATGAGVATIAFADVNLDGRPDILVTSATDGTVSVFVGTTAPGSTTASFSPRQVFAVGSTPRGLALGDVNGDGRPDLVVACAGDSAVSVLVNTTAPGATTASFASALQFATDSGPADVAVADVNGDGLRDLVTANANGTLSVLFNATVLSTGVLGFAPRTDVSVGGVPSKLALADVDGDGRLDVAVGTNAALLVLRNTTAPGATTASFASPASLALPGAVSGLAAGNFGRHGRSDFAVATTVGDVVIALDRTPPAPGAVAFTTVAVASGASLASVCALDVDGDGALDLAVCGAAGGGAILRNTTAAAHGAGWRTGRVSRADVYGRIAIGDLDGDGKLDVVAPRATGGIQVLPGRGDASLASGATFLAGRAIDDAAIADLDGDGRDDVVAASAASGTLSLLRNTTVPGASSPTFAVPVDVATGGSAPGRVVAADLNGDGKPDLVVGDLTAGIVSVLLNTSAPGGPLSFAPPYVMRTGQTNQIAVGDLDGDGTSDIVVTVFGGGLGEARVFPNDTPAGSSVASFRPPVFTAPGAYNVALADVNADGRLDLVAVTNEGGAGGKIAVCLNATQGGFALQFAAAIVVASVPGTGLTASDLDGDGLPEILFATNSPTGGRPAVTILPNETVAGSMTLSIGAAVTFGAPASSDRLAVVDFDGDGRPDLVQGSHGGVGTVVNTGAGAPSWFEGPAAMSLGTNGTVGTSITMADFDGDGRRDLVFYDPAVPGPAVALNASAIGSTTLAFGPSTALTSQFGAAYAVCDLNGDGRPDVVVVTDTYSPGTLLVFMNQTAPGATVAAFGPPVPLTVQAQPSVVAFADVNRDGRSDLLLGSYGTGVTVLLNETPPGAASPTFSAPVLFVTGASSTIPGAIDVNGDGIPDLVVGSSAVSGARRIDVLLGSTPAGALTPSFSGPVTIATTSGGPFVLADMNGDGRIDVVTSTSVLINTSAPGSSAVSFAETGGLAGLYTVALAVADLDGDGRLDIVVSSPLDAAVSVYSNVTSPAATSFAALEASWTTISGYGPTVADLNGDGRLDIVVPYSSFSPPSAAVVLLGR